MYDAANIFFAVLLIFQGYCIQYFYGSFLESRIKSSLNGLCAAVIYIAARAAIWELLPSDYESYKTSFFRSLIIAGTLFIIAVLMYKGFRAVTIFLVITFQAVTDISSFISVIISDKISDAIFDNIVKYVQYGNFRSERDIEIKLNVYIIGVRLIQFLIIMLLIYFTLKIIVRDFKEKKYSISRTELLFLITPSAVGLMICIFLRIILITAEDGATQMLYERYPAVYVVVPAILLLSLLSVLFDVKLFQDMIHLNAEKSSRIILEQQIDGLQTHIEEMERIYSDMRGVKHDLKNTVSVIRQLSNNGKDNAELQTYISEMSQCLEKLEVRFNTGNTVADTLLNMKYYEAVRNVPNINIYADDLIFSQELKIHSYDIGIILGNALDNAIEACKKLKINEPSADTFIRLRSVQKGNFLILTIENSFYGKLVINSQNELPATDKADKKSHGIGLANIKSTAEKYNGTMDFKAKDRVFILSVMMKNERRN
ncbi:MAG: GHKL domain-containing protein [Oscillospiraceae bacterium]|nr:GHKL domain-containing protein [Oscillospiraceae bacterium]